MTSSPWFVPSDRSTPPQRRLFCVPFAGGGAGIYASWAAHVPDDVEVVPVHLPGRERRIQDPPYTAMRPLVRDLFTAMAPHLDRPFAIFGHSMGAAIAYELARAATLAGHTPDHLFVSARRAPGEPPTHPPLFALPKDRLVAETERLYGPMPAVVRRHPALLDTFLPTMRADFQLLDTWVTPGDAVLTCPVTAYAGADDQAVPPEALKGWSSVTRGPFRHVVLPGGHFGYVRDTHDARDDVATVLRASASR